jgi:hypothetical protein
MKKLFVYGCVAVLGTAALASCKKDYTCTDSDGTTITYSKLSKTEATAAESGCALIGGTWKKK